MAYGGEGDGAIRETACCQDYALESWAICAKDSEIAESITLSVSSISIYHSSCKDMWGSCSMEIAIALSKDLVHHKRSKHSTASINLDHVPSADKAIVGYSW